MKNYLIQVICLMLIILGLTIWILNKDTSQPPKRLVVDIPKLSDIKDLEKWAYSDVVRTKKYIVNPDKSLSKLPVIIASVKNIEFENGETCVSDEFTFDASQSYNEISDETEASWYFNDKFITNDLYFKYELNKKINYIVRFVMIDKSNPEYDVGASATFTIPYADASDDFSPLDTDIKYDD